MSELITTMFQGFTEIIPAIMGALKDGFQEIIYVDPSASTKVVSDFAKFGFLIAGLGLGLGLTYFTVNLIRRKI